MQRQPDFLNCPAYLSNDGAARCGLPGEIVSINRGQDACDAFGEVGGCGYLLPTATAHKSMFCAAAQQ
jgi:hypothetical protein